MKGSEICISTNNHSQFEVNIRCAEFIGSNYVEFRFQDFKDVAGVSIYD